MTKAVTRAIFLRLIACLDTGIAPPAPTPPAPPPEPVAADTAQHAPVDDATTPSLAAGVHLRGGGRTPMDTEHPEVVLSLVVVPPALPPVPSPTATLHLRCTEACLYKVCQCCNLIRSGCIHCLSATDTTWGVPT